MTVRAASIDVPVHWRNRAAEGRRDDLRAAAESLSVALVIRNKKLNPFDSAFALYLDLTCRSLWGCVMSISRRNFLALLGTAVAGASAVGATSGGSATLGGSAARAGRQAGAAKAGKKNGVWIVREIGAVRTGAVPITLTHRETGENLLLEACQRGMGHTPVAQSAQFDLYLVNQGAGNVRTDREHVLAARALAGALDRLPSSALPDVLTMADRAARHPELREVNDDLAKA